MELRSSSPCPDVYNHSLILDHYNFTNRLQFRKPSGAGGVSVATALFLAFSVFIVLENLAVLLSVLLHVRLRHRWIFICISNIALSDLLTGAAYVVNICLSGGATFRLSARLWLLREGLVFVALAASIFSLLLIAVERYCTMMKPLQHRSSTRTCRIYTAVALCWLAALLLGLLPLMGWNCVCHLRSCSTLLPLYSKSYVLFALLLFVLILLTIGGLYSAIYWRVRSGAGVSGRGRGRSLRLLKAVVSVVGVFVMCWAPLFVLLLVDFFCQSRRCAALFRPQWVIALAVLNSALNPLIYSSGSREVRRAVGTLLLCCCLRVGLCHPETFTSQETSSSFSTARSLRKTCRKPHLSSTTSGLSSG